jgi:2'-5' RNA ligase
VVNSTADTALIVPVELPPELEVVRRRSVADAVSGLPAHVTLLYPFVPVRDLNDGVRAAIAAVVAAQARFSYRLVGPGRWPETQYASVEPEAPFRALQADLAAAFPNFPLHGGAFDFVPHVTIAEGEAARLPELADDRAWAELPATATARMVDLLVRTGELWSTKWTFPLGSVRV